MNNFSLYIEQKYLVKNMEFGLSIIKYKNEYSFRDVYHYFNTTTKTVEFFIQYLPLHLFLTWFLALVDNNSQ